MAKKKEKKPAGPNMMGKHFRLEIRSNPNGGEAEIFLCDDAGQRHYWVRTYIDPKKTEKDAVAYARKDAKELGIKKIVVSINGGPEKDLK